MIIFYQISIIFLYIIDMFIQLRKFLLSIYQDIQVVLHFVFHFADLTLSLSERIKGFWVVVFFEQFSSFYFHLLKILSIIEAFMDSFKLF